MFTLKKEKSVLILLIPRFADSLVHEGPAQAEVTYCSLQGSLPLVFMSAANIGLTHSYKATSSGHREQVLPLLFLPQTLDPKEEGIIFSQRSHTGNTPGGSSSSRMGPSPSFLSSEWTSNKERQMLGDHRRYRGCYYFALWQASCSFEVLLGRQQGEEN